MWFLGDAYKCICVSFYNLSVRCVHTQSALGRRSTLCWSAYNVWSVPYLPAALRLGVSWIAGYSVLNQGLVVGTRWSPHLEDKNSVCIAPLYVVQLFPVFAHNQKLESVFCIKLGGAQFCLGSYYIFLTSNVYFLAYDFSKLSFFLSMFNLFFFNLLASNRLRLPTGLPSVWEYIMYFFFSFSQIYHSFLIKN